MHIGRRREVMNDSARPLQAPLAWNRRGCYACKGSTVQCRT